ncbi:MAG: sulfotransferase [Desulfococcaceae bacterium]|jgi:tetratricopeptide (TPR) repeat protein|nr:sulfotransferase [Desulfococcaceae bacterium]
MKNGAQQKTELPLREAFQLAFDHHRKGDLRQAAQIYRDILRVMPDHPEVLHLLGVISFQNGDYDTAIRLMGRAVEMNPKNENYYSNLGNAFKEKGENDAALKVYRKAVEIRPDFCEAWNNMGLVLNDMGRFRESRAAYRKAIDLKPDYAEAYKNLANALILRGKPEESLAAFRKALEIDPDCEGAVTGEARVFMGKGELKAAFQNLEKLLDAGTENVNVLIAYAGLAGRFQQAERAVRLLENYLQQKKVDTSVERRIRFRLGELYDTLGKYDLAFANYRQANQMNPRPFNAKAHSRFIEQLISVFPRGYEQKIVSSDRKIQLPVFIVGMPRSGTSLVEQILSVHPFVYGGGELATISRIVQDIRRRFGNSDAYPVRLGELRKEDMNQLADQYLEIVNDIADEKMLRVTDKMPQNFLHLGLISRLFPDCRIIHCIRDPRDTGLSIYFQYFLGAHSYAFDLKDIGLYYRQYERIMGHWRKVLPVPMLEIRYEVLVSNPERISRRIVEFLGLEWNDACLDFYKSKRTVSTASFQQVRQPVYQKSAGRWKYYRNYLKPMADVLNIPV